MQLDLSRLQCDQLWRDLFCILLRWAVKGLSYFLRYFRRIMNYRPGVSFLLSNHPWDEPLVFNRHFNKALNQSLAVKPHQRNPRETHGLNGKPRLLVLAKAFNERGSSCAVHLDFSFGPLEAPSAIATSRSKWRMDHRRTGRSFLSKTPVSQLNRSLETGPRFEDVFFQIFHWHVSLLKGTALGNCCYSKM